jgi:hypothetical protein
MCFGICYYCNLTLYSGSGSYNKQEYGSEYDGYYYNCPDQVRLKINIILYFKNVDFASVSIHNTCLIPYPCSLILCYRIQFFTLLSQVVL